MRTIFFSMQAPNNWLLSLIFEGFFFAKTDGLLHFLTKLLCKISQHCFFQSSNNFKVLCSVQDKVKCEGVRSRPHMENKTYIECLYLYYLCINLWPNQRIFPFITHNFFIQSKWHDIYTNLRIRFFKYTFRLIKCYLLTVFLCEFFQSYIYLLLAWSLSLHFRSENKSIGLPKKLNLFNIYLKTNLQFSYMHGMSLF